MPKIAAIHLSYNKKHKEMELNIRSLTEKVMSLSLII